jgi:hypothetical protein
VKNVSDVLVVSGSDALKALAKFSLGRWWGVSIRNADDYSTACDAVAVRAPQFVILDMDLSEAMRIGETIALHTSVITVNGLTPVSWATQHTEAPFQAAKLHAAIAALPD